jgi:hypothetical protein
VRVAQSCGVNPQALLVLLEKEQGLVSSTRPSVAAYDRATGFGCPDTAPCASQFFGFANRVWRAARRFQIYRAFPSSFNHRAGQVNDVRCHPNAWCGSSPIFTENQATAGLYNYTPYQPNGAALSNLYGSGDVCSAYGNRNFWRIFSDWFGNPKLGSSLLRSATDPTVHSVTDDTKHAVRTGALFSSLGALGRHATVSQAYLDRFASGPDATNLLRDPTNGFIFFTAFGVKHQFTSCESPWV